MGFQFNIYSLTLLASGMITGILAVLILRKKGELLKWFGTLIVAISFWAHTYGLELASASLSQMLFFIRLEYLAIATVPALWIIFVIKYIRKNSWLNLTTYTLIFLIPVLTIAMVWTNPFHHLHYTNVKVDNTGDFPLLDITRGIWYQINTVYYYLLMAMGLFLLALKYKKSEPVYRSQHMILIIAALIPWLTNLIYLVGIKPFGHLDLTPFAFSLTGLCVAFGILRYKLFELLPVARDKVLEIMQDGVLVLDQKNRVVFANTIIKKFLDVQITGLTGTEIEFLFPHEDKLLVAIKNRLHTAVELKLKLASETKYFEVLLTPIYEKNEKFSGQLVMFRDVTNGRLYGDKLKSQTDELIALNNLKDRLFSIIAHDLQGPMGSLKELLIMADTGEISENEIKHLLPHISKYVFNISDLMENLLHWSRSQLSGVQINKQKLMLNHIISSVLNLFEKRISEKHLTLNTEIDPNVEIFADKNMMEFIIRNLMANAIKFCNTGDTITLRCVSEEDYTTITIADTGVGIKEENLMKLFGLESFTTKGTKAEKGTGLGLLLCKEFIEKNNGKIWAESTWGKGSTFSFTIPVAVEHQVSLKK